MEPHDVADIAAALTEVPFEPAQARLAGGGRGGDHHVLRIDVFQDAIRLPREGQHLRGASTEEPRQVRLVPDLVMLDASPIPRRDRPYIVPPVLEVARRSRV